jgi:endoglucanase
MKEALPIAILLILSACSSPWLGKMTSSHPTISETPIKTVQAIPLDIFRLNQRLRRTVNLGNALEAPNEGEWGVTLQEDYFQQIADAGFTAVRVPISFPSHALNQPPFTLDPIFMQRVDWVIQNANSRGMVAILDMHNYPAIMNIPAAEINRFVAMWEQLARRYQDLPDEKVFFELLNEPFNNLDDSTWNTIFGEILSTVRLTNPSRPIIVGPSSWNAFDHISDLQLPNDPNLIITFHYYQPFQFTHQGAEWVEDSDAWMGTSWDGTPEQLASIAQDFDLVADWASLHNYPVFVGEFGAYSKGDQAARVRWTTAVARAAEERGFSWGYWEFCAGFGIFDPASHQWHEDLLHALIPVP